MPLQQYVIASASTHPQAVSVEEAEEALTYADLDARANRIANALASLEMRPGDRVGIRIGKSFEAIAVMQGALRAGAAYVPVDPLASDARAEKVIRDCGMRVLATPEGLQRVHGKGNALVPRTALSWSQVADLPATAVNHPSKDGDLAYILYTSGSTGDPKGVCISHGNAMAFIEWAAGMLAPTSEDRFTSHAPFHFDLSVLDLYVAFLAGARVALIPEMASWHPRGLVEFLIARRPTVWYSVPSALILMMEYGGLLDHSVSPLRALLFAGEPFPIKHLRRLWGHWPSLRYLNLYGPTETNVCTYYDLGDLFRDPSVASVPIGKACSGDRVWARADDGSEVSAGEIGELMVEGPTVMMGYWGKPPQRGPYATGDLVRRLPDGNYDYVGRRDHMVKVRGYRVELGDVEAALADVPGVREIAVVVIGSGLEAQLAAVVAPAAEKKPGLLDLKRHCAERLTRHMIVDRVFYVDALPRTRNGKVDRKQLIATLSAGSADGLAKHHRKPS